MRWRTILVALFCVTRAVSASAQYHSSLQVNAVVIPVTVRDRRGHVMDHVARTRFHLYVDGMHIPIQDLKPENDLPLSLGFILDTSGSMEGSKIEACRDLIMAFLKARRPGDEYALWTFGGDTVRERFPFGMDWYLLPRILESIHPWSTTALYDMIERVPEVVATASHPRRAVILLTDGVDDASKIGSDEATTLAQRLKTPVYVVGVEPPPRLVEPGGATYEEVLELIAELSGGRYERVPAVSRMPHEVHRLLRELSSRYILTFTTSGIGRKKWRSIKVTVDGYTATTRHGYYGTLP